MFERRHYSSTGTMRFYTWLIYRQLGSLEWQSYGDPWPKPRLNKRELTEVLDKITFRLLQPGQRVRMATGAPATIVSKHEPDFAEVFIVKLENGSQQFEVPAKAIAEVL
jgi:hypothetical protein